MPAEETSAPARMTSARPTAIALAAVFFFYAAVLARTPTIGSLQPILAWYMALEIVYLVLFSLVLWRPPQRRLTRHLYFLLQSGLVLFLLLQYPRYDFLVNLFVLLSYQAALVFSGRERWGWVSVQILLICIPLMMTLGAAQGLALALLSMAVGLAFPAYATAVEEIEDQRSQRELLLSQLQATNRQLSEHVAQVEELSALQERDRLAHELHDSVSQTLFSIGLHSRAARLLIERDPGRLKEQLERLQSLTHDALDRMRSLIAEMHPPPPQPGEPS